MTPIWEALTAGAAAGSGSLNCWTDGGYVKVPWAGVSHDAERLVGGLRQVGVRPGETAAAILTNTPAAVRGTLGTWLAGGRLASLPVPARGMDADAYLGQLEVLCRRLAPSVLLVDAGMVEMLEARLGSVVPVRSWESLAGGPVASPSPPGDDDIAFVQFSSGSTSVPKGCMLTTRAIETQVAMIMAMLDTYPGEGCDVSWLPLSHDMGMFGNLLTPWANDVDLVLSPPERFMMNPRSWFDDISRFGGTFTCSTNTGLHVAAVRQGTRRLPEPLKLRTIILGAERLNPQTLDLAIEAFGPDGLTPEVLMPAYGLAEATLAVTATPVDEPPRSIVVDSGALAEGRVELVEDDHPTATRILSGGRALPGIELPGLREDLLAEIVVSSPCLSTGYVGDPERTAERFVDGAFHTGDLGFLADGHLYPVGRADDVIQVGGRNVHAQEIEALIDEIPGVRKGCSTIVAIDGEPQRLVLLAELTDDAALEPERLAEEAAGVAMSTAAVSLDQCVFLARGALPKTPSGKIQRYRCRTLLLDEGFEPTANITFGQPAAS